MHQPHATRFSILWWIMLGSGVLLGLVLVTNHPNTLSLTSSLASDAPIPLMLIALSLSQLLHSTKPRSARILYIAFLILITVRVLTVVFRWAA
ncbi:MAG: hypothetical protein M3R24_31435 [Chloroflexota bacterium]|nr:hypothetical protein [Chloroflexota bacterium]